MSRQKNPSLITRALSWTDSRGAMKRFFYGLLAVGAGLTVFDLFYKKKVYFEAEYLFGFYSLVGFLSCLGVVLIGWFMRLLLARREDYYAPHDTASEQHPAFDLGVASDWGAWGDHAADAERRDNV